MTAEDTVQMDGVRFLEVPLKFLRRFFTKKASDSFPFIVKGSAIKTRKPFEKGLIENFISKYLRPSYADL